LVLISIPGQGYRPPKADHPGAEVFAIDSAGGNEPAVAIGVLTLTCYDAVPDPILQDQSRLLPAPVLVAVLLQADLSAFRSVDPKEPNSSAMDFNGVAVDYRRSPSDDLSRGRDACAGQDRQGAR
jgi:hypothetical protein